MVEVIEHLENPWHALHQIKSLLKVEELFLSPRRMRWGFNSRRRFFFTREMAMVTDGAYDDMGHIASLMSWHLDNHAAKVAAWFLLRPFMFGTVGGQCVLFVFRKKLST
jgi:hypothetical protein